jgi:ribosomal protein S18 acetylase RimI-like enzyme
MQKSTGAESALYRLVPASSEDEAWLGELRRGVYQELFHATFGGWDEARHSRHVRDCWSRGHISIIWVDATPIGMIQIFEQTDCVDIGEIQIQPSHQNLGIGGRLLNEVIKRAHGQGKRVTLSVGVKNERAYRLYQRLGFRNIRRTDTHHQLTCDP